MCYPYIFSSFLRCFSLAFLLLWAVDGAAQTKLSEAAMAQDFMRFLAVDKNNILRVDHETIPWKLSEVYANDSLWATVNLSDDSRVLSRTGWFGAGPLLKYDHGFTPKDFQAIRQKIRNVQKTEWLPTDFSDSVMVLTEKAVNSSAYFAYSVPLVFPDKKLVLVKKKYHSEKVHSRWSQLEVYQFVKPGQYRLRSTYLQQSPKN